MEEKTVVIPNISCMHCAAAIRRELNDVEGIVTVEVYVASKSAHIRWDAPADWPTIRAMLEDIGYPPAE